MSKRETRKGQGAATGGATRPLTAKQEKFCQEYQIDCNATQAAVRAGYKPTAADSYSIQLLRNSKVSVRIAELQAIKAKDNGISVAWVLDGLKRNAARAMQEEAVLDREGNPTGEYRYEGTVANRAYELIGKHIGMFSEGKDTGERPVPTRIIVTRVDPPKRGKA